MRFSDSRAVLFPSVLVALALSAPGWGAPRKPASKPPAAKPAAAETTGPSDPAALIAQARAASAAGNSQLAERLAQAAIVADPARPSSYVALADIYAADHQPDFARAYYDEALSIDPTDEAASRAEAALAREGDTRKAEADGAKRPTP